MGFKITRDFIEKNKNSQAVGTESVAPTHWLQMYMGDHTEEDYNYKGGKIKFRLLDDDENIYYHGLADDDDLSTQLAFDWGRSYAGTVGLDLHIDSYRELYGEPKHKELISKCGKWYGHIG